MSRWIYGWILSALGFLVVLIPACNQFSKVAEKTRQAADQLVEKGKEAGLIQPINKTVASSPNLLDRNSREIIIGSLNIKTFGPEKVANKPVMKILADVARQFDVLAIQEIRSKRDQTILDQYVRLINSDGKKYSYVISALLGSNRYFEQYAFIYDTSRIELLDQGFVVPDPNQLMHREPMVARFRVKTTNRANGFSFALANVHIDPDKTRSELTTLYHMLTWTRSYLYQTQNEDDVIVLGDFNEPPRRYGDLWQIQTLAAVLSDSIYTNTAKDKSYDNILFDQQLTREYTGKSGVIDLESAFGLTYEQAKAVSDHLPVWASFSAGEFRPAQQIAGQSEQWQR